MCLRQECVLGCRGAKTKRFWNIAEYLLGLLALGVLVVALVLIYGGLQRGAKSTAPVFQTPTQPSSPLTTPTIPRATPTLLPVPSPLPVFTPVFPTPPTPITTTAQITREQAIAIVMSRHPDYADLQARGQLTVTTTLTTYGEFSREKYLRYHPLLPVWIVRMETQPWTEWRGPEGGQSPVTFRGFGYVIDAVTGEILVPGFRIPGEEMAR